MTWARRPVPSFSRGKAANQVTTPYGIPYSPH
jgi:hypothetical protein